MKRGGSPRRAIPTTDSASTIAHVLQFLRRGSDDVGRLSAVGVGSFGPVQLDRKSAQYGFITRTPKAGWSGTDMIGPLAREFACVIGFDTDVNAAAMAEHRWGAAQDVQEFVYLTVGTGIGGGALINGRPIHGLMHPEIGHLYPRRHPRDGDFAGVCPFIRIVWRESRQGRPSWRAAVRRCRISMRGTYSGKSRRIIGQLCAQLVLTLSPQRIVRAAAS